MIRIITDTASDFELKEGQEKNIKIVPLNVRFGEETYVDLYEISKDQFYQKLATGVKGSTSQPAPESFVKVFEEAKQAGDIIIVIALSSKVSGTYQSAKLAMGIVDYDQIYLVDSLSASIGERLIVEYGYDLIMQGKDAKEIVKLLEEAAIKTNSRFLPDEIDDLLRLGRLSKNDTTNSNGNARSIIQLKNGSVSEYAKCRGLKNAINAIIEEMENCGVRENQTVVFGYTTTKDSLEALVEHVVKKFPDLKYKITQIGPIAGAHFGCGTIGISYISK